VYEMSIGGENYRRKYNSSPFSRFEVFRELRRTLFPVLFLAPFQISVALPPDIHPSNDAVVFGVLRKPAIEVQRNDFRKHSKTGSYHYGEVARSILIAIAATYALDLAGRVTGSSGRVRVAWLIGGAIAT
jgi:hypothetical protein